jgi:hypothetical protein
VGVNSYESTKCRKWLGSGGPVCAYDVGSGSGRNFTSGSNSASGFGRDSNFSGNNFSSSGC